MEWSWGAARRASPTRVGVDAFGDGEPVRGPRAGVVHLHNMCPRSLWRASNCLRLKQSVPHPSSRRDPLLSSGARFGTVAKCYGQGHWAYGRVAAKDYAKAQPSGANNNEILVDDCDRLSGATARNGGFTGVRIQKA